MFRSDGTSEGTTLLYLPGTGRGGQRPTSLFSLGNRLYFAASAPSSGGEELWISDGTDAGTVLLKDLNPGPGISQPRNFVAVGDRLFFTATVDGWNRALDE